MEVEANSSDDEDRDEDMLKRIRDFKKTPAETLASTWTDLDVGELFSDGLSAIPLDTGSNGPENDMVVQTTATPECMWLNRLIISWFADSILAPTADAFMTLESAANAFNTSAIWSQGGTWLESFVAPAEVTDSQGLADQGDQPGMEPMFEQSTFGPGQVPDGQMVQEILAILDQIPIPVHPDPTLLDTELEALSDLFQPQASQGGPPSMWEPHTFAPIPPFNPLIAPLEFGTSTAVPTSLTGELNDMPQLLAGLEGDAGVPAVPGPVAFQLEPELSTYPHTSIGHTVSVPSAHLPWNYFDNDDVLQWDDPADEDDPAPQDYGFGLTFDPVFQLPSLTGAEYPPLSSPGFALATGETPLDDLLGSPNAAFGFNAGVAAGDEHYDIDNGLDHDGGGVWASEDEEASNTLIGVADGQSDEDDRASETSSVRNVPVSGFPSHLSFLTRRRA